MRLGNTDDGRNGGGIVRSGDEFIPFQSTPGDVSLGEPYGGYSAQSFVHSIPLRGSG